MLEVQVHHNHLRSDSDPDCSHPRTRRHSDVDVHHRRIDCVDADCTDHAEAVRKTEEALVHIAHPENLVPVDTVHSRLPGRLDSRRCCADRAGRTVRDDADRDVPHRIGCADAGCTDHEDLPVGRTNSVEAAKVARSLTACATGCCIGSAVFHIRIDCAVANHTDLGCSCHWKDRTDPLTVGMTMEVPVHYMYFPGLTRWRSSRSPAAGSAGRLAAHRHMPELIKPTAP